MPRLLASLCLLPTACAFDEDASEPLLPDYVYELLLHHTVEATGSDGARYLIRFERVNYAERIGKTSEYVRWYADAEHGLCFQDYRAAPVCAPLYQISAAHFRWGDTTFSDLTIREPGLGGHPGSPMR